MWRKRKENKKLAEISLHSIRTTNTTQTSKPIEMFTSSVRCIKTEKKKHENMKRTKPQMREREKKKPHTHTDTDKNSQLPFMLVVQREFWPAAPPSIGDFGRFQWFPWLSRDSPGVCDGSVAPWRYFFPPPCSYLPFARENLNYTHVCGFFSSLSTVFTLVWSFILLLIFIIDLLYSPLLLTFFYSVSAFTFITHRQDSFSSLTLIFGFNSSPSLSYWRLTFTFHLNQ